MQLMFDFERSLEAATLLLDLADGRMEYIRLLKLLYIAERELLAEAATPLTGDLFKALPKGPILDTIYELITRKDSRSPQWQEAIRTAGYSAILMVQPRREHLAPIMVQKLQDVHARYQDTDAWDLVELTHGFPEWIKYFPGGRGAGIIPLEGVLEGAGADPQVFEIICEEEAAGRESRRLKELARTRIAAKKAAP